MAQPVSDYGLVTSYVGLLNLAFWSIYAGSFSSLPPAKDDDEEEEIPERVTAEDAWLFPILGSIVLGGLYLSFKYINPEWINRLFGWYFAVMGVASVWKSSVSLLRFTLGRRVWKGLTTYRLLLLKGPFEKFSLSLTTPALLLAPLAAVPSVWYILTPVAEKKPALVHNILALSFCHNALSIMKLDGFKTGTILLAGLFVYDIWWVFGTEVMVKVATSLDAPIKLLWPKSGSFSSAQGFTLLGLGDVVIPGTFISLALRYDLWRSVHRDSSKSFSKPYFTAAMTAYILGLGTTMAVMHIFHAAQPALLYLSPACILSFVFTGLIRGELRNAWTWQDEEPKPKDEAKKE